VSRDFFCASVDNFRKLTDGADEVADVAFSDDDFKVTPHAIMTDFTLTTA